METSINLLLDQTLKLLDPSVPVSITEHCGDLLLQDLTVLFEEEEKMTQMVTTVKSKRPNLDHPNTPVAINEMSLKEFLTDIDDKKLCLYKKALRCLLFPAVPTGAAAAMTPSKNGTKANDMLLLDDSDLRDLVLARVIENYKSPIHWIQAIEKRITVPSIQKLQQSIKGLLLSNSSKSNFLSPGEGIRMMRSSTPAMPFDASNGPSTELKQMYQEDLEKFLAVQTKLLTPRKGFEEPLAATRAKLAEFLEKIMPLLCKWLENEGFVGEERLLERQDRILNLLLGSTFSSNLQKPRSKGDAKRVVPKVDIHLLGMLSGLDHSELHETLVKYESKLCNYEITATCREFLPFYETEINTRAFSLFKMENDLAISEMRRFILQHHLRSAQMERFVARISFKVADLDRGTDGFLEFLYEKQDLRISLDEGSRSMDSACVYLTSREPSSKLKIRLWKKPCEKSPALTRRSQSTLSLASLSSFGKSRASKFSASLKGVVKDMGVGLGLRKNDSPGEGWIKMKCQLLGSDLETLIGECQSGGSNECHLLLKFQTSAASTSDYGSVSIQNDESFDRSLNSVLLSCQLLRPQPPLPESMRLDYHKFYALMLEDFMSEDCRRFVASSSVRKSVYRPWKHMDGTLFLTDFGVRYGVGTLFRLLSTWRVYLRVLQNNVNSLKLDSLFLKNKVIHPIHLIVVECGKLTFSDQETAMFEDLVHGTENTLIVGISKFLQENIIMHGSTVEFVLMLETLKALHDVKGAIMDENQEASYLHLVRGIFSASAISIYDRIASHVGTFSTHSQYTRLIRLQEFLQVYLKAISHVQISSTCTCPSLQSIYTKTLYSRWLEEIDRLPWKCKSGSNEWSIDAFQLLHTIQSVIKATLDQSNTRFLILNWLKCIEQEGCQFTINIVNQDRLNFKENSEFPGSSPSLSILRKFQNQTLQWLQLMRHDLEQLQSSSWDDIICEYGRCMEKIFAYYKSWMDQSLDLIIMGLARTGTEALAEDIPDEICIILSNVFFIESFRNELLKESEQKTNWLEDSIEHITSFFTRWIKWVEEDLAKSASSMDDSKNSSASSILGIGRKPVAANRNATLGSLRKHEKYLREWKIFRHVVKPIERLCHERISRTFEERFFESCCNALLKGFIRVCDRALNDSVSGMLDVTAVTARTNQSDGSSANKVKFLQTWNYFKFPAHATQSMSSKDASVREEFADSMERYFHQQVQNVMDIFGSLEEFFAICGGEGNSNRDDEEVYSTLLARLPQESSQTGAYLANHLYRHRGNTMKIRLYTLIVRFKALHLQEKEASDCVRCLGLDRDLDSVFEREETDRIKAIEDAREQWTNIDLS